MLQRGLLAVAALALFTTPAVALGTTGPAAGHPVAIRPAPLQQLVSAEIATHAAVVPLVFHHPSVGGLHGIRPLPIVHVEVAVAARPTVTIHAAARPAVTHHPATAPLTHERVGDATWYDWYPGQCAVHYLPKGTRIWVTDLATGKTISCLVTDYEADGARAVDLSETCFEELAPLAQGVIEVRVRW